MQGRGVSPIGYLGLGEGLRGGEGALRKAISIGGCEGVTRGSSIVSVANRGFRGPHLPADGQEARRCGPLNPHWRDAYYTTV